MNHDTFPPLSEETMQVLLPKGLKNIQLTPYDDTTDLHDHLNPFILRLDWKNRIDEKIK